MADLEAPGRVSNHLQDQRRTIQAGLAPPPDVRSAAVKRADPRRAVHAIRVDRERVLPVKLPQG